MAIKTKINFASSQPKEAFSESSDSLEKSITVNLEEFVQVSSEFLETTIRSDAALRSILNARSAPKTALEKKLGDLGVGTRPVILGSNELIPLKANSDSTNDVIDNVNINFGEDNIVSVTNIVRLIELQDILNKIINKLGSDIIIESAFDETRGFKAAYQNADSASQLSMKESIITLYNSMKNTVFTNQSLYFLTTLSKIEAINKLINENNHLEMADPLDRNFVDLLANMAINDVYINSIKNFYLLLFVSNQSFTNMIDILQVPAFYNENLNSMSELFKNNHITVPTSISDLQKHFLGKDFKPLSSTNRFSNMSNFLNLTARLINFSNFLETKKVTKNQKASGDQLSYNIVHIGSKLDLYKSFHLLKQINLASLISPSLREESNSSKPELKGADIERIFNQLESGSRMEQISEILSAICFDHVIGANATINTELNTDFLNYIANNIIFFPPEKILSGEASVSFFADDLKNQNQEGTLFSLMFGEKSNQEMTTIPHEYKNALLLDIYSDNVTADSYNYFVLSAIGKQDYNLTELESFLNNQKIEIENIIKKFIDYTSIGFDEKGRNPNENFSFSLANLNPMSFLNFYLQTFATDIRDGLQSITGDWEEGHRIVPHFAMAAHAANNTDTAVKSFKCAFLGALMDVKNSSSYLFEQGDSAFSEYYNNKDTEGSLDPTKSLYNGIVGVLREQIYRDSNELIRGFWANGFDMNDQANIRYGFRYDEEFTGISDRGDLISGWKPTTDTYQSGFFESEEIPNYDSFFNQAYLEEQCLNSITEPQFENGQERFCRYVDYYGEFIGSMNADPALMNYLDDIFTDRPKFGDNGRSIDANNINENKTAESTSEQAQNTPEQVSISDIESEIIGDVPGVQLTKKGKLHSALLINKALLNNSSYQNNKMSYPDINNLGDDELKKLVKRGYFMPTGAFRNGLGFKASASASDTASGGPLGTTTLHLSLIFHLMILEVIRKTQSIGLGIHDRRYATGPAIHYSVHQIIGLMNAFQGRTSLLTQEKYYEIYGSRISPQEAYIYNEISNDANYMTYRNAFIRTKNMLHSIKFSIISKSKEMIKILYAFQNQIQKGINLLDDLRAKINSANNLILRDIAITISNNNNSLTLDSFVNASSLNYALQSYNEKFSISVDNFPLPTGNILSAQNNDLKIMYKILTSPGYGFLSSENFGSKRIFHVGISQLALNDLYRQLGEKSNLICLIVERKNNINLNEKTIPKYFLFDISKFISPTYQIENPVSGIEHQISSHIGNFLPSSNFESLINSIEFLELNDSVLTSKGTGKSSLISNASLGLIQDNYDAPTKEKLSKELQINHIFDYYLKLYTKATTELDFKEVNFAINDTVNYENTIDDFPQAVDFYIKTVNNIKNRIDSSLSVDENTIKQSERAKKIIRTAGIFNSNARAENSFLNTGVFSRVFSFLINDGDFIKYSNLNDQSIDDYNFGAKLTNSTELTTVEDASIYSFTIKAALLKRW
tara:strand:+ start:6528 stop:10961 length:4434 start_codon:yes stop_codon:yes gene_type:complete